MPTLVEIFDTWEDMTMDAERERFILDFIQMQKEYWCVKVSQNTRRCSAKKKLRAWRAGARFCLDLSLYFSGCCGVLHCKMKSQEDRPWLRDVFILL